MLEEKPLTGRNSSFTKVLSILDEVFGGNPITIVETGCIRNTSEEAKIGDGWSTVNWDYYAKKTNSSVYVVDISWDHVKCAMEVVPPSRYVTYTVDDSVHFLENFPAKIDFLFLDSYDYCGDDENIRRCHEHSLNEVKAAWNKLGTPCLILIDDVFNDKWDGKGKLSIPYLFENGFVMVHHIDGQMFMIRK